MSSYISFSSGLGGSYGIAGDPDVIPIPAPLTDWGNVAYTYVNDAYLRGTDGAVTANASYRHAIITVEPFWRSVRVAGVFNIGASHYFCTFFNAGNVKIGHYLQGTGANVTLDPAGNGIIPIPVGTAKIGLNQLEVNTAFTVEALNVRVLMIGDSTSSSGGNGIGDDMATLMPTRTFYQQGIGGQYWTREIRYRMGLERAVITVTGGIIPADGSQVACTLPSTQSLLRHQSTNVVVQVRVNGVRCALRYTQTTNSYTMAALDSLSGDMMVGDVSAAVVTGIVVGASPDVNACPKLSEMLTGSLWIVRGCPSINDKWVVNYPRQQAELDKLLGRAQKYGAKVCLVGMMNGQKDLPSATYTGGEATTAAQSSGWLAYVDTMNSYLSQQAAKWDHVTFVDIQAEHIANDGSTVESINGTNYTVLTNTATNVKLSDSRHETTAVQANETAPFVKAAIDALGW